MAAASARPRRSSHSRGQALHHELALLVHYAARQRVTYDGAERSLGDTSERGGITSA